jgi:hypothetical protein
MYDGLKLVEKTSSQDVVVGIIHFDYIEKQILGPGILNSAKGYWK